MRIIGFCSALCLLLAFLIAPAKADACSCGYPDPVIFTADGNVPADLGGVAVWRGDPFVDEQAIEVDRWVEGAWVSEDVEAELVTNPGGFTGKPLYWVRPTPFAEGDRFRFRVDYGQFSDPFEVEVDITAPLAAVEGQPTLVVGDEEVKNVSVDDNGGGSCDVPAWSATRRLSVKLPAVLEPYRELLLYETMVDGSTWRPQSSDCGVTPAGRSWQREPGVDLLAALCECAYDGVCDELLEEGAADVQIHAFFPGSAYPVWSTAVVQTSLLCPTDCVEFVGWESGFVPCDVMPDEVVDPSDDSTPDEDTSPQDSGGTDEAGGCSTTRGSMPFGLVLAACLLLRRRQPRRRRAA